MKDKWMNIGHEEEELRPYIDPENTVVDPVRIGM